MSHRLMQEIARLNDALKHERAEHAATRQASRELAAQLEHTRQLLWAALDTLDPDHERDTTP